MSEPRYCPRCATPLVRRQESGRERLACPSAPSSDDACKFVHWDNPLPVVAALIEHPKGIILARGKGWPETWFGLITGFLERGETPEQGVVREVREELSVEATVVAPIGVYAFHSRNEVILAFHVRAEGELVLDDELEAVKFVPEEKLRPWPLGTGEAVRDWLERRRGR
jgi:NAD+ diphosphatase